MSASPAIPRSHFLRRCALLSGILVGGIAAVVWPSAARTPQGPAPADDDAALLEGFRHVEVASVSDALEQLTGRKMYMSHRMRPIFPSKFAGLAVTVLLKKETSHDPEALRGMLAVIDGGVRDVAYLQKIGFPVYALGIVPSTSISHYRFAGANIPVVCDGVPVNAADIVVADADGVVVVPRAAATQALKLAQELDFKEHSMYAYIEKLKSIEEAVKKFGRL